MVRLLPIVSAKQAGMRAELSRSGIFLRPLTELTDSDRIKFGFDKSILAQYMRKTLNWDVTTIENDATSIWETHNNRRGDYSSYFGTSSCLAVFVTSNSKLLHVAKEFKKENPYLAPIQKWRHNRLPIITDMRLTCRLWAPEVDCQRISLLHLSANAYAAQQPTQKYMNRVRDLAKTLKEQVPEYGQISLSEFFDDTITNRLVEVTGAQEDNLDIGVFTSTIAEFAEMKAKEQEEITEKAEQERDEAKLQFEKQTDAIISDAVRRNIQKSGCILICLWIINNWLSIASILFVALSSILSVVIESALPLLLILIPVILKVLEVVVSSDTLSLLLAAGISM